MLSRTRNLFELTEDEKRELAGFDQKIGELQRQKELKLRKLARQKGISALKLEDLESECGQPFVEEKEHSIYRRAMARDKTDSLRFESAYLCASRYEAPSRTGNKDTCGWVKGEPREERYDSIGPLCGSAGIRFYCRICGKMVGELQARVS